MSSLKNFKDCVYLFIYLFIQSISPFKVHLRKKNIVLESSMNKRKFWRGTSSSNFYKAIEDPKSGSTKNQYLNHCLSGRYVLCPNL